MNRSDADETARLETALGRLSGNGDEARDSLGEIYDLMSARMLRAAFSVTGSRPDAEDALQDSLIKLFRATGAYRADGHPQAYILTVVRHAALDVVRRRQRALDASEVTDTEPEAPPDTATDAAAVAELLSVLEPDDRLIITLKLYEEMPYREIARVTGLSVAAAEKRYQRALARLRKFYT